MKYRPVAGVFLFIGAVQFIFGLLIAEFLYPGYNASVNYISDLGATCHNEICIINQPSAQIFNISIFIFGCIGLIISYFFLQEFQNRFISSLFSLTSIGMISIGLFPETAGIIHTIASFIAFFFGGLTAIASYKLVRPPFSYLSVLMGSICLTALALFGFKFFWGLGPGGMERMIAYPLLLWAIGLGGNLMSSN